MLRRYGLKRLADKYFKGLISCVIKEGNINRRLETFGQMCGLTLEGHKAGQAMSESQCSFFFHALGVMFGNNLHLLQECMNSFVSFDFFNSLVFFLSKSLKVFLFAHLLPPGNRP